MQTNVPAWLSLEEAAKTAAYFRSIAERFPDPLVSVQSFFGRCCLSVFSDLAAGIDPLSEDASRLGEAILSHPNPDKLGLDPLLLIEIYTTLRQVGIHIPSMSRVLERISAELSRLSPDVRSMGRLRHIVSRLKGLGYSVDMVAPSKESAALLRSPGQWFNVPAAVLSEIADHLAADCRMLGYLSTDVLSLIALAELRNYRFDVGCKLLRTAIQTGESGVKAAEAMNFVALQRRRDGYYGFSSQFVESGESAPDKHLALYLPLTLNAVWLFKIETESRARLESLVSA